MVEVECLHCGKKFMRKKSHVKQSKSGRFFCSGECQHAHSRKQVTLTCTNCGKEFTRPASHAGKGSTGNVFCSKECKDDFQRIELTCTNCGKQFKRPKHSMNRVQRDEVFCCEDCHKEYRHKHNTVELVCDWCGKEYTTAKSRAVGDHHFCSSECYNAHKQEYGSRPRQGVMIPCSWCGKEIYRTQWYLENRKEHFCSRECADAFYVGKPRYTARRGQEVECAQCGKKIWKRDCELRLSVSGRYYCSRECMDAYIREKGVKLTPEWRERARQLTASWTHKVLAQKRMTKPQIATNEMLDELGISYINEDMHNYYAVDNFLPDSGLVIEVQGDYWHSHPMYFQKMTPRSMKQIRKDKARRSYFKSQERVDILYLWETDVNKRPDVCKALIQKYVDSDGKLPDYQSYNYHLKDGCLLLNEEVVAPYIDYDVELLRTML